jgi:hypothetical protein
MSVAFTVAGSAAAENVIWMVALAATCVVPDAGVIDFTEKAAAGVGLTGAVLLPLPQPVKIAKDKAIEETKLQKRNFVPSFIEPTVVYASGRNQSSLSNINQAPAVRQTLGTCSAADARHLQCGRRSAPAVRQTLAGGSHWLGCLRTHSSR